MTAPSNANTSGLGDVGLSETYRFAYESIRNGAPGLSDATCAAIARSINMKVSLAANDRATAAEARADRLAKALERIERWFGEFPETGKFWPNTDGSESDRPMSYGACWGSNGERDSMRSIARAALQQETQP